MGIKCAGCGGTSLIRIPVRSFETARYRCEECNCQTKTFDRSVNPPKLKPTTVATGVSDLVYRTTEPTTAATRCSQCNAPPSEKLYAVDKWIYCGPCMRTGWKDALANYERVKREHDELKAEYDRLASVAGEFRAELKTLQTACGELAAQNDRLKRTNGPLKVERSIVQGSTESVTELVQAVETYMHTRKRGLALDVEKTEREVWRAIRAVVSEGSERK